MVGIDNPEHSLGHGARLFSTPPIVSDFSDYYQSAEVGGLMFTWMTNLKKSPSASGRIT